MVRSIYAPSAYQYFDYKHRLQHEPWNLKWITTFTRRCGHSSVIGEVLVCHRDTRNRHDPLAFATRKGTTDSGRTRSLLDGCLCDLLFPGKAYNRDSITSSVHVAVGTCWR